MPNISDQITREHILKAVKKIEAEGLEGTSQKYEVMINGKAYPPPLVCQYADYFAKGQTNLIQKNTFPVGTDTRCFRKFEEAGFKIIQKEGCHMNSAYEIVSQFLEDAEAGNLKTKHYPPAFSNLTMKVSFGQGALAKVPWIAFLKDGQEVQKGIYPVYLYYKEFNCLILAYGVSQNNPPEHHWPEVDATSINEFLKNNFNTGTKNYTDSNVFSFYDTSKKLNDTDINKDLEKLLDFYIDLRLDKITPEPQEIPKNLSVISKPFILLAGISGTGKSRFVRKQAEKWTDTENFELVPVRPDWHEPSDLLGYVLRLKDKPEFISTPVIKFLVSAWLEAYKQGIVLEKNENNQLIADCTGKQTAPFWLCLDEMNLAPVEQYFADYLSVLETREWNGEVYNCDPLIKPEFLKDVINENESQVRNAMGLNDESEDSNHDALWMFIKENGLPIPFNLIVAGTVNMDETTHGFSRKVIDRALSLDFGEFFPNDFDSFFNPASEPITLSYPKLSHSSAENVGDYAQATIDFLNAVNAVLKDTLFELAYRALNECLLAVASEQPEDEKHLQAVWDDFLMMKVLPRIEGDEDKLQSPNTDDNNLFIALENLLKTQFDEIWEGTKRPDLLREHIDEPKKILIKCRSKTKIQRMSKLLENGFTSFWP